MKYTVVYGSSVRKDMRRLDKGIQEKLFAAANALCDNPRPHGCRKISGYPHRWRIRVGDYRVVYDIDDNVITVHVIKIGHRGDVYR